MKRTDQTKFLIPLVFLAAGLFLCILCCSAHAADEKRVDVLTIADSTGDWGFPSPYCHNARGPGYLRMSLIFDTLIWKDQSGFVPALAETWEYLPEEKAYVFHLHKGVTWNDGERFTAKDVVFSFQYIKDHPYFYANPSIVKSVEAIDDNTVKVILTKGYVPFLNNVAGTLPILPEHIYKNITDPQNFKNAKALTGTGPFKLVNYDMAQGTYLYEANEAYYQGSPKVKQIKFVKVSAEMSAAALKRGDVDAVSVPAETVDDLKKAGFTVIESAHDLITMIEVNFRKEPFSDEKFRQALYYAINRQEIVDTGLRGFGLSGSGGLISPDNPWYNPNQEQYAYDPVRAGQLLEELGYEKNVGSKYYTKDGKPEAIEMLVTSSNENIGELIKKQLDEAGIQISLRSVDSKTLDSQVNGWQFDLALTSYGGMGADPAVLKGLSKEAYGFHNNGYEIDPELEELFDKADSETNPEKRKELVFQIQEAIGRNLLDMPICYTGTFWASNDKVRFYYTYGGIVSGIPQAMNKMVFV